MIKKKERFNLIKIIYCDLCTYKLQLLLLVLILISALFTIVVTYNTRHMVAYGEDLLLQKRALELEWNNLVFEEEILSNPSRIENIALNKLNMCYSDVFS